MTRHYSAQGHFKAAGTVYANTLKFFTGNYKDVRTKSDYALNI